MKRDIDHLRRDMREMEQRMVIKLAELNIVEVGTIAALVKRF